MQIIDQLFIIKKNFFFKFFLIQIFLNSIFFNSNFSLIQIFFNLNFFFKFFGFNGSKIVENSYKIYF